MTCFLNFAAQYFSVLFFSNQFRLRSVHSGVTPLWVGPVLILKKKKKHRLGSNTTICTVRYGCMHNIPQGGFGARRRNHQQPSLPLYQSWNERKLSHDRRMQKFWTYGSDWRFDPMPMPRTLIYCSIPAFFCNKTASTPFSQASGWILNSAYGSR